MRGEQNPRLVASGDGDTWQARLSEYLDDELDVRERRRVDQHLAGCESCRQALDELRVLVARAPGLRHPVAPPHDLWPGVERRLDAPRHATRPPLAPRMRVGWLAPRLALAAALLLACVAVVSWFTRPQPQPPVSVSTNPPAAPIAVARDDRDPAYDDAVAHLRREAHERLTADPHVVTVLERNLSALDRAIAEYGDALAEQPGDQLLRRRLEEARRRKLEVLQHAAGATLEGTN